jgi:hypothetical protein
MLTARMNQNQVIWNTMWCVKSQESSILTLFVFDIYACSQFNNFCLIFGAQEHFLQKTWKVLEWISEMSTSDEMEGYLR